MFPSTMFKKCANLISDYCSKVNAFILITELIENVDILFLYFTFTKDRLWISVIYVCCTKISLFNLLRYCTDLGNCLILSSFIKYEWINKSFNFRTMFI